MDAQDFLDHFGCVPFESKRKRNIGEVVSTTYNGVFNIPEGTKLVLTRELTDSELYEMSEFIGNGRTTGRTLGFHYIYAAIAE
jgi:hypothetical protein